MNALWRLWVLMLSCGMHTGTRLCVLWVGVAIAVSVTGGAQAQSRDREWPEPIRYQAPEPLTFEDIKALSTDPYPVGAIRDKYETLWVVPIISNEAFYRGARPHRPFSQALGPFLRVVSWNIEKSLQMNEAIEAFTDPERFVAQINAKQATPGSRRHQRILAERAFLDQADVIVLQEMDIGMKRSGYRDAARDLAEALHMNYAYLPAYVEVDPVPLGLDKIRFQEGQEDVEATTYYAVDPERYKGLFGSAVLSRYPIIAVEGFRLFNQTYDWYWQEKQKLSYMERLRRFAGKQILDERSHREMKVGGRTYFRVDLYVPELPEQRVSVINIHLEIKCTPQALASQMVEILHYIKDIQHPVILAGDFNSAPQDLSATSTPRVIERSLTAPEFWLSRTIDVWLPHALLINTARVISNTTKNYQNPTALHIPLVAPNDLGELFKLIERFRFRDGGAFDFRGGRKRSAGRAGKLSNSNERDRWAYKATFQVQRPLADLIGKYRLDWIFVKAYLKRPSDRRGPYRFAPHFGRTLNRINKYLTQPISDHDPNVVDLPLDEPPLANALSQDLEGDHAE